MTISEIDTCVSSLRQFSLLRDKQKKEGGPKAFLLLKEKNGVCTFEVAKEWRFLKGFWRWWHSSELSKSTIQEKLKTIFASDPVILSESSKNILKGITRTTVKNILPEEVFHKLFPDVPPIVSPSSLADLPPIQSRDMSMPVTSSSVAPSLVELVQKAAVSKNIKGPGLSNGMNRCYFNATLKSVMTSISFQDQLKKRHEALTSLLSEAHNIATQKDLGRFIQARIQEHTFHDNTWAEFKHVQESAKRMKDRGERIKIPKKALVEILEKERLAVQATLDVLQTLHSENNGAHDLRQRVIDQRSRVLKQLTDSLEPFFKKFGYPDLSFQDNKERDAVEFFSCLMEILLPNASLEMKQVDTEKRELPSGAHVITLPVPPTKRQKTTIQSLINGFSNRYDKHFLTEGHAPDLIPIQLMRFDSDSNKIQTEITISPIITIPYKTKKGKAPQEPERYVLSSVLVHRGTTLESGHYYSYLPDSTSLIQEPNKCQFTKWIEHNDLLVQERSYTDIENDMKKNGYLLLYQKIERTRPASAPTDGTT